MLSLQDVIDYCDLDSGEVEAIAEHEHMSMTMAAELSDSLLSSPEGVCRVHVMFLENMQHAMDSGNFDHLQELVEAYQHLQRCHPLSAP